MRKELIFIVVGMIMLFGIASPIAAWNRHSSYQQGEYGSWAEDRNGDSNRNTTKPSVVR